MVLKRALRAVARGPGHLLYEQSAGLLRALCRRRVLRAGVETVMRGGGRALLWAFDAKEQDSPEAAQREWERILTGIGLSPRPLREQAVAAPLAAETSAHEDRGSVACATCFARCTLSLKGPADARTCDTVMSINDEMIRGLGGTMHIEERLTDVGGTRCVVRIGPPAPGWDRQPRRIGPTARQRLGVQEGEQPLRSEPTARQGLGAQEGEQPLRSEPTALAGERELWCDEATALSHFDRASGFYDFIMGYFEVPANQRAVRRVAGALGERPVVLDLGVGTGLGLVSLLRRLPAAGRVIAMDTSSQMLRRSRRRVRGHGLADRVTFVRADAARTGLADRSIDGIYSSFLLDLLTAPKRRAILREARRVLRPGGLCCFLVMDGAAPRLWDRALSAVYNAGYQRWNPVWMALFSGYAPHCRPVRLRELLEQEGFAILARDRSYVTCFPVAIYIAQSALALRGEPYKG